ncbi:hypothetical protein [Kordia sp.]|uniref:hypothetical protein n=1 Tax=Kordia sp. TaxID=1965332 RepID=UPI003B5A357E
MKIARILFGIILSFAIPFLGLLITSKIDNVNAVILTLFATPILAIYLKWFSKYKFIGLGMLIGLLPVALIVYIFSQLSRMH